MVRALLSRPTCGAAAPRSPPGAPTASTRGSSRRGPPAGARAPRTPPRPAPLRRRAVRARLGARHAGSQARLRAPCSARSSSTGHGAQPRRPSALAPPPERLPERSRPPTWPGCWTASRPPPRSSCATVPCSSSPTPAGCAPGDRRPRRRLGRLRRRGAAGGGQGRQDQDDPGGRGRAARRGAATWSAARQPSPAAGTSSRCSSPSRAGASRPPTCAAGWRPGPATRRSRAPSPPRTAPFLATHLLDGGADLRAIQELWATRRISATQVYTRVESARLRAAYARSHPRGEGSDRRGMETNVKAIELRELWRYYKDDRGHARPRAARRGLLPARQVRGRPHGLRAPRPRRGGRPHLLRAGSA